MSGDSSARLGEVGDFVRAEDPNCEEIHQYQLGHSGEAALRLLLGVVAFVGRDFPERLAHLA